MFGNGRNSWRALRYASGVFFAGILIAVAFSFLRSDKGVDRQPSPHALQQQP
jgi:hypothetical protein